MSEQNKLPLRQKANPPVLRYSVGNQSNTKPALQPVKLFHRSDVQSLKYGGFAPVFQSDMPSRNDVINMESLRRVGSFRSSDPYSRPFNPRQTDDLTLGLDRKPSDTRLYNPGPRQGRISSFVPVHHGNVTAISTITTHGPTASQPGHVTTASHHGHGSPTNHPGNGPPTSYQGYSPPRNHHGYGVQTNSFMRPKSAVVRNHDPPMAPPDVSESENDIENDPPTLIRDLTETRSFVLFSNKPESSFEMTYTPAADGNVTIRKSESVIKSLQRPLSAVGKSQARTEADSPDKIRKSSENLYSAASGNALRNKVKENTPSRPLPSPPTGGGVTPGGVSRPTVGEKVVGKSPTSMDISSLADSSLTQTSPSRLTSSVRPSPPIVSPPTTTTSTTATSPATTTATASSLSGSFKPSASSVSMATTSGEVIRHRPPTPRRASPQPQQSSPVKRGPQTPPPGLGSVRNPRYTPTKPYDEVKDPIPASAESSGKTAITSPAKSMESSPTKTASSPQGKPPSGAPQGKTKSVLIEQRPEGDGAPAAPSLVDQCPLEVESCSQKWKEKDERLPGDGETSVENSDDENPDEQSPEDDDDTTTENDTDFQLDVEDDVVDNLDDDVVDFSGDDSDGISMTSSLSVRSGSARGRVQSASRASARIKSAPSSSPKRPLLPGLTASLFTGVPPTVNFCTQDQRIQALPWEIRKMLKWRLSPITPNIVKTTVARSGFRITKRNYDWIGCWGRHMKSQCFKALRDYQKINHFPGTFQIGRKDRLWRNLYKLQLAHGKKEFGFFPQTYVLPADMKRLRQVWDENLKQKWIIKPPASARGIGIRVIHKWNQIPRRRPVIVQKYLSKPYLINQSKFDLRIYVYVTSYDPLRIYIFEDGLVRFASQKYSSSMKYLSNKFMHLTNYSINKRNSDYQSNGDDTVCQGHKWSLKALWGYLENKGINTQTIWNSIKDVCVKCVISAESAINSLIKSNCKRRYCVHELFGFDIFLDDQLKPWIIEVNISPSLHSNSQLDINVKGSMIKDLMNMAGFMIPDKREVVPNMTNEMVVNTEPNSDVCIDKRLWQQPLASDEKAKHAYFVSKAHEYLDTAVYAEILDTLTPDDVRILIETLDEDNRKGGFERVFPSITSNKYEPYFEQIRYYNLLLDAWIHKYSRIEQRGIALLETYCRQNLHLAAPTLDPAHQWTPPNQIPTPRTCSAPPRKPRETLPIRTSFTKRLPLGIRPKRTSIVVQSTSLCSANSLDSSTSTASTLQSCDGS